jgi:DNA-binding transcriptional MerR regulator
MTGVAIGEAARASRVKVPTIRYYEQVGLLPAPGRTASRRRLFTPADLHRLAFIRHARELGFEVEAIRALLKLHDDPGQSCAEADAIAQARLVEVERRIASLTALREELTRMIAQCQHGTVGECRVIETLSDQSHRHGRLD